MDDAIRWDHDGPESRRGTLRINLWACVEPANLTMHDRSVMLHDDGTLTLTLSDADAISLYEQLRSCWAGYVAERDQARAAVARGATLADHIGGWRAQREADLDSMRDAYDITDPKHPDWGP